MVIIIIFIMKIEIMYNDLYDANRLHQEKTRSNTGQTEVSRTDTFQSANS